MIKSLFYWYDEEGIRQITDTPPSRTRPKVTTPDAPTRAVIRRAKKIAEGPEFKARQAEQAKAYRLKKKLSAAAKAPKIEKSPATVEERKVRRAAAHLRRKQKIADGLLRQPPPRTEEQKQRDRVYARAYRAKRLADNPEEYRAKRKRYMETYRAKMLATNPEEYRARRIRHGREHRERTAREKSWEVKNVT